MSMNKGNLSLQRTPTPRELAATLFRQKKVIGYSFALILIGAMLIVFFRPDMNRISKFCSGAAGLIPWPRANLRA